MIRSMTGYGEAERPTPAGRLRVELKSVNHRFLNTSLRTPAGFDRVEQALEGWIRPFVKRGHLTLSLTLDRTEAADATELLPRLDFDAARHYRDLLEELRNGLGLEDGPLQFSDLVRFSEIFRRPDPEDVLPDVPDDEVRAVVEEALGRLVEHREAEGARLREDMEGRLDAMAAALDTVEARAPERLIRERDRLREAVKELAGKDDVDEDRLAREVAYLAEKWDINEEIVRFRSHVGLFRETLDADAEEPAGKRLSFLVQEMHREANTIGSKANDAGIAHAAVSLKEEIERLREQVENVE